MKTLFLASDSQSRKTLLQEAAIPFRVIPHCADEHAVDRRQSFADLLLGIARAKMKHTVLPAGNSDEICFVLTADSMCQDSNGVVHGKPVDKTDAMRTINALNGAGLVGTAFCLEKREWRDGRWHTVDQIEQVVHAAYVLDIPEHWIAQYLDHTPHYLSYTGGLTIERFGAQFVRSISGSYTTILGLPMFEVREALQRIGFF
jgi:septum formation protein